MECHGKPQLWKFAVASCRIRQTGLQNWGKICHGKLWLLPITESNNFSYTKAAVQEVTFINSR